MLKCIHTMMHIPIDFLCHHRISCEMKKINKGKKFIRILVFFFILNKSNFILTKNDCLGQIQLANSINFSHKSRLKTTTTTKKCYKNSIWYEPLAQSWKFISLNGAGWLWFCFSHIFLRIIVFLSFFTLNFCFIFWWHLIDGMIEVNFSNCFFFQLLNHSEKFAIISFEYST